MEQNTLAFGNGRPRTQNRPKQTTISPRKRPIVQRWGCVWIVAHPETAPLPLNAILQSVGFAYLLVFASSGPRKSSTVQLGISSSPCFKVSLSASVPSAASAFR
jgi:hypothetical protein